MKEYGLLETRLDFLVGLSILEFLVAAFLLNIPINRAIHP
jgi:hypothetical protein